MKNLSFCLAILLASCTTLFDSKPTKGDIVEAVIEAYFNRDIDLMIETLHPKCKELVNDEWQELMKFGFQFGERDYEVMFEEAITETFSKKEPYIRKGYEIVNVIGGTHRIGLKDKKGRGTVGLILRHDELGWHQVMQMVIKTSE